VRHLGDLESYADGLRGWLRGEDSDAADAAGICVVEVLAMIRETLKDPDG
jgi:hypothetical protein